MLNWMAPHHFPLGPDAMEAYLEHRLASTSRQQRNRAEKQRRDKINSSVQELAGLVPMVSSSPKRLDKTSILRLSANFLRMARCEVLRAAESAKSSPYFPYLCKFLQGIEGFLMVVDSTGKILVVTETVEKVLGHSQNELLGHSLYNFTATDNHAELRRQLAPDGEPVVPPPSMPAASPGVASGDDSISSSDSGSSARSSPPPAAAPLPSQPPPPPALAAVSTPQQPLGATSPSNASSPASSVSSGCAPSGPQRQRRCFTLQLSQRAQSRGDATHYEPVLVQGYLEVPARSSTLAAHKTSSGHGRKTREVPAPSASDIVLVAVVQQYREKRPSDLSLLEATRDEYVTRHFKDGRIKYSDHRISVVAGYLAEEVAGLSAFAFMHKEDVNFTVVALQQMYDMGEGAGGSAYRLKAKTGQYIYLRTQGFLEFNKSGEVDSLICINSLLSEEEGKKLVQEMKKRFAASIAKCHQITRTGGPLAKAVTPDYIPPHIAEGSDPITNSVHIEEACYTQSSPCSEPMLSPQQDPSPGSSQFANMALYSPPGASQPSSPHQSSSMYSSVITCPSNSGIGATRDRPTVLRTHIAERVSVLTTAGTPESNRLVHDVNSPSDSRWSHKVSVLKRVYNDTSGCSSKRQHTGSRSRRRDSEPAVLNETLQVEVNYPPVLSPEEQHQILQERGMVNPCPTLPMPSSLLLQQQQSLHQSQSQPQHQLQSLQRQQSSPLYNWPAHPPQSHSDAISPCFPTALHTSALLSPGPTGDHDADLTFGILSSTDDLLDLDASEVRPEYISLEALQGSLADAVGANPDLVLAAASTGSDLDSGMAQSAMQQRVYRRVDQALERGHLHLESSLAMQESQISRLEQDLETVPLTDQPLRSTLSQLQVLHRKQQQMLNSLIEDHQRQRQDTLGQDSCVRHDMGV